MNRIIQHFKNKPEDNLNIYFTAGYPRLEDTTSILAALNAGQVDLVEIGMPYSDPMADGPVIQESSTIALQNGMKLDLLLEQVATARAQTEMPFILMGYYNQVMQYGEERFFKKAKEAGADGFILPDLPYEIYAKEHMALFEKLDLGISFLVSPQTSEKRIRDIDQLTRGFIYLVSSFAITGGATSFAAYQQSYFDRINAMQLQHPTMIGFGISDKKGVEKAFQNANGAIIGSAFIRALKGKGSIQEKVDSFIQKVRPS